MNQEPVSISPAQWPEARSFERLYHGNPEVQARLVQALLGFRAVLAWEHNQEGSTAVNQIIAEFTRRFPEYISPHLSKDLDKEFIPIDYVPDERLLHFLPEGITDHD